MDACNPDRFAYETVPLDRRRRVRATRRAAVLREIEQRSGDAALSPATVAASLGITPRYVHMLLKETGLTFSRHLLEKRLEKAVALLGDSSWCHRRIGDIALEAGFSDLSHFSRAFRRKYGETASAVRAAARRGFK